MFWALDKGDATIFERSPLEKIASQKPARRFPAPWFLEMHGHASR